MFESLVMWRTFSHLNKIVISNATLNKSCYISKLFIVDTLNVFMRPIYKQNDSDSCNQS